MAGAASSENKQGWHFAGRWLLLLVAVVVAILLVQSISYSGLMRSLAEWQFVRFGRYFPVFTLLVLAGIAALVWRVLVFVRRRARRERAPKTLARLASRWHGAAMFLAIAAAALAILALGVAIHFVRAPGEDGKLRVADLSRLQGASFAPGSTRLEGIRALGPIGLYTEDLLFSTRTYYFVPAGRAANGVFNLFIEIDGPDANQIPASTTGLLRTDALPSEVAEMYRLNRMPVAAKSSVLFKSERSANRPILILLGEVAAFALLAALFAFLSRRRARKLEREKAVAAQLPAA